MKKHNGSQPDFIEQVIDRFKAAYQDGKGRRYIDAMKGKTRSFAGKLVRVYKEQPENEGRSTEEALDDFTRLFIAICKTDFKSSFLNDVTLEKVVTNLNSYMLKLNEKATARFVRAEQDERILNATS